MCMPEVVEPQIPNARSPGHFRKLFREFVRIQRSPFGIAEDRIAIPGKVSLTRPVNSERFDRPRWQSYGPTAL